MGDGGPVVWLFAMGGTIASIPDDDGLHTRVGLSADDLVRAVPELASVAELRPVSFRQQLSADLGFADVVALAGQVDLAASSGATGVVVAQGTDTLEETAFLLDRLVESDVPVVVTGAMRHAGSPGADGPANLLAAVQVAADPLAAGLGTLVVFNDEVHAARFVRKTHTTSPATFASPGVGPLGWINQGRVRIPLVPRNRTARTVLPPGDVAVPRVALARLGLGEDATLLQLLVSGDFAGVVIEVYGAGHLSAKTTGVIEELSAQHPVVFASRTGAGELHVTATDIAGAGQDRRDGGPISAAALDGLKARLLLTLLLAAGADRPAIVAAFARTLE
jgi:L-asparaginase